jgi:adenylate cyclase
VNSILEGSVQKVENRLRITVKLINASDESLRWSEQYNRELDDVFAIQDDITDAIVDNLKINLLGEEKARLKKRYTDNNEAFQHYLKGIHLINVETEESLESAIEHFKKAIEKDPDYALAYAGISRCYDYFGSSGYQPPNETFPKAKEYALKALELDDTLDEAHGLIADIKYFYEWDWPGAEKAFKRAIELNPSNVLARRWYALFLILIKGETEEGLEELRIA